MYRDTLSKIICVLLYVYADADAVGLGLTSNFILNTKHLCYIFYAKLEHFLFKCF